MRASSFRTLLMPYAASGKRHDWPLPKTKLKTGDYIIVAVVLLCAALLSFGFAGKSTPRELTLSIGGETAARYVLPLRAEYPLDTLPYPCTLRIDGYSVSVRDTTCPGHDCEHSGTISQSGGKYRLSAEPAHTDARRRYAGRRRGDAMKAKKSGTLRAADGAFAAALLRRVFAAFPACSRPRPEAGASQSCHIGGALSAGAPLSGVCIVHALFPWRILCERPGVVLVFPLRRGAISGRYVGAENSLPPTVSIWGVSVAGAAAHNLGQVCAAAAVMRTGHIFAYLPVLLVASLVTGAVIAAAALPVLSVLRKWRMK